MLLTSFTPLSRLHGSSLIRTWSRKSHLISATISLHWLCILIIGAFLVHRTSKNVRCYVLKNFVWLSVIFFVLDPRQSIPCKYFITSNRPKFQVVSCFFPWQRAKDCMIKTDSNVHLFIFCGRPVLSLSDYKQLNKRHYSHFDVREPSSNTTLNENMALLLNLSHLMSESTLDKKDLSIANTF